MELAPNVNVSAGWYNKLVTHEAFMGLFLYCWLKQNCWQKRPLMNCFRYANGGTNIKISLCWFGFL